MKGTADAQVNDAPRGHGALRAGADRSHRHVGQVQRELHRHDHEPGQRLRVGHAHDVERQVLSNTGTVGFTYTAAVSATANTLLWSDPTNGVQVTVKRGATTLFTGALKNLALAASPTVAAGGTDTLTFDFSLPAAAGNTFQNLTQDFTITYTSTQLAGAAR